MKEALESWERPFGDPARKNRDIVAVPYDRQEKRVAAYFWECGVGGGDDPVGSLIACNAALAYDLREARAEITRLKAEKPQ